MTDLELRIDELYQLLPGEFTTARNALARMLSGEAARDVKALAKPATVPWAVNQVFWKARPVYDRVMKEGRALRAVQVATLEGKTADVRSATEAHRKAIADAVTRARAFAADAGVNPDADQLTHMFESVSLAATPPEHAGRFTKAIGLSGFEALAGVTPIASVREAPPESPAGAKSDEAERRERRERRTAEARLKRATERLENARERESAAREALAEAKAEVAAAEQALAELEGA